jgi:hypothetical protein
MTPTPDQLKAWREATEGVTPGPWRVFGRRSDKLLCIYSRKVDDVVHWAGFDATSGPWTKRRRDAAFIALSRQALPALLDEVEALRAERDALRERLDGLGEEVVAALQLVLPMAKGYASEHRVGSNADYVRHADDVLAAWTTPTTGDENG